MSSQIRLNPRQSRLLLALLACMMLAGCGLYTPTHPGDSVLPEIELLDADLIKARPHRQEWLLHLRIHNPRNTYLPIQRLQYRAFVDSILLGEGEISPNVEIAPLSARNFDARITSHTLQQARDIARLLKARGNIPYRIEADLATGWIPGSTLEIRRLGTLTPPPVPPTGR